MLKQAAPDERAVMEMKTAALFTHDVNDRILTSNESDAERAPRLFLGRTPRGHVWRFRDDVPQATVDQIERLLASEPPLDLARAASRPVTFAALRQILEQDAPVAALWEGPAWTCPPSLAAPPGIARVEPGAEAMLREHFPWTSAHLAEVSPCFAVIADGQAVSIAYSSRLTPEAAECGVNTVDAFRGRGYAARVVAAWAYAVRASGRLPIYSTSWDNLASQAVARKLGLMLFGTEMSID